MSRFLYDDGGLQFYRSVRAAARRKKHERLRRRTTSQLEATRRHGHPRATTGRRAMEQVEREDAQSTNYGEKRRVYEYRILSLSLFNENVLALRSVLIRIVSMFFR